MLLLARCLITAALVSASAPFAWSQPWPAKPIRLLVNFPAGGTTDLMARAFADSRSNMRSRALAGKIRLRTIAP